MNKKNNIIPIIEAENIEWDKVIFIILAALAIVLPLIFLDHSVPAFTPIKDLSLQLLSLLGLTFWILKMISTESISWRSSSLDKPLFSYLLWGCFSLIWSINVYSTILFIPLFLSGPIILFIINNSIREQKSIDRLLLIIIVVGFCFGIYGILQYYGIDFRVWERDIGRQRVMGVFGNVNYFAEYLIFPLSLSIGLILSKNKIFNKFFLILGLLAMGLALLFTFTRGSYLAIAITIPMMLFLYFKSAKNEKDKKFYMKIALLFLLLTIIAIALIYVPHPLNKKGTTLGKLRSRVTIETLTSDSSILNRIAIWKYTWMMIEDYTLLGSGLGTYAYHTLKYQTEFFDIGNNRDIYSHVKAVQAHNEYLQLWSELGIIGLLLFLWTIFAYYRNIFINIGKVDEKQQAITIGLTGGVTAVLVDAIFGFPLQLATSVSLFWMFLGLTVCQINIAIGNKKGKTFTENSTNSSKKEVLKSERRGISFLENTTKKRIAYTIVIVLMAVCLLSIIRPFIARVYLYYGNQNLFILANSKKAIKTYQKALKWNPWQGEIYFELANNLKIMGDNKSALENLHKAESYTDNYYLPGNIAYLYNQEGESIKAIPYLEKAIKYQKNKRDMVPLQLQVANIYLTIDDNQNAERHFNDVIKYNSKNIEAHYGLANVYIKQGKVEQAKEELERVIELEPESKLAEEAREIIAGRY